MLDLEFDQIIFTIFLFSLYPDTSRLTRFIKPLAEQMSTQKELRELKDLISSKKAKFEKASQGVRQAIETIEINNQWKTNNYQDLSRYLTQINFKNSYSLDDDSVTVI